jgi:hypothetical protein
MQTDGNFVVYDAAGNPLWTTETSGTPDAHLVLQDDGNVVVYRADGQESWDRVNGAVGTH